MPEIVLHYIWEHCLWAGYEQQTTDGRKVEILSVGEHNRDAGPDYSHARVRIDGKEWVGNIEIHVCSSDWGGACFIQNEFSWYSLNIEMSFPESPTTKTSL